MSDEHLRLNSGQEIPRIGFGTWRLAEGDEAKNAVGEALKAGYRLVDTARIYRNEQSVGEAIAASGLSREEIYLTTKLWPQDFDDPRAAFETSLKKLGMDYIDLYLIHWPNGDGRRKAWRELTKIHAEGKAKAVGVSNYMVEDLEELFGDSDLMPAVNQIEFHPFIYEKQKPVLELCRQKGIAVEAYSPLMIGRNINHPGVTKVAKDYGKSNAQVILRWCLQRGTVPLPRSTNPAHIKENIDIFDFELSEAHLAEIDDLSDDHWQPNEM